MSEIIKLVDLAGSGEIEFTAIINDMREAFQKWVSACMTNLFNTLFWWRIFSVTTKLQHSVKHYLFVVLNM